MNFRGKLGRSVLFLRRAFDLHQMTNAMVANDVDRPIAWEVKMNCLIASADRTTHLKILLVALFWSTAVLVTAVTLH